ncbi:hypothetical protein [Dendronalium sp. ChiSLP03b]|uniref:nucleotide-binding protein n=1 Tax=Dendronalium sp. ChiSLP03b TaxID=3075381 RepID=UPI002AD1D81A|nr:hypothetical protein [Dendronalium sp. ChiSLP03b]MDZ8203536.1 hypothetical protein [Dendronalium sp. ChiSLP03b]
MTDTITTKADIQAQNINKKEQLIKKYSRRLVIVTGDKGGVGKSTFARGLVQTYIDAQQRFVGFDADISNSQLVRFYGEHCPIEPLNIFKNGNIDKFFDGLKKKIYPEPNQDGYKPKEESRFLLELPPQSRIILQRFIQGMDFLETAEADYDMRVTMVVVISRISDSVNQLINLHSFCGQRVDYLVVKNLFFGEEEEFTRYNKSREITEIMNEMEKDKSSFITITMPELIEHAYDYLDEKNMTFKQGMEQKDLPSVKGRVTSWLRTFKEQIKPAQEILGLDDVKIS